MTNIIDEIASRPGPNALASWWHKANPMGLCDILQEEEVDYLDVLTSEEVDHDFRIPEGVAIADKLTREESQKARNLFGESDISKQQYCNYENRRRIVANYVLHHPAMIAWQVQTYRATRDVIHLFLLRRGYTKYLQERRHF